MHFQKTCKAVEAERHQRLERTTEVKVGLDISSRSPEGTAAGTGQMEEVERNHVTSKNYNLSNTGEY